MIGAVAVSSRTAVVGVKMRSSRRMPASAKKSIGNNETIDQVNAAEGNDLGISVKTMNIHRTNVKVKPDASTLAHVANAFNLVRLAELADGTAEQALA